MNDDISYRNGKIKKLKEEGRILGEKPRFLLGNAVLETQEPVMGQPATFLAQTLLGLPEVLGAPREPGGGGRAGKRPAVLGVSNQAGREQSIKQHLSPAKINIQCFWKPKYTSLNVCSP